MAYRSIQARLKMNAAQTAWLRKQLNLIIRADAQLQRSLRRFPDSAQF